MRREVLACPSFFSEDSFKRIVLSSFSYSKVLTCFQLWVPEKLHKEIAWDSKQISVLFKDRFGN